MPYVEKHVLPSSASTPAPQSTPGAVPLTDIALLTTTCQLGKVQKIYKNDYASDMTQGLISYILGVLCFLPLLFASSNGGASLPTIGSLRGSFGLIIVGLALLGYGIYRTSSGINKFITNTRHKNPHYYLCSYGILSIKGKQVQVLRWDQVKRAQKNVLTGPPYQLQCYVLCPLDDREPMVLEPIVTGVERLIMQIEREIARYFLPRSMAAYKAGQRLNFGALEVTSQGLSMQGGEQNLSWEMLGSVDVREGMLIIKEKGTLSLWAKIDVEEIHNLCVFRPLLSQIKDNRLREMSQKSPLQYPPIIPAPAPPSEWQEYE